MIPPEFLKAVRGKWAQPIQLDFPLLVWMAVHGHLVLALKHPYRGPFQREFVLSVVDALETCFEQAGVPEPPQGWRGPNA